MRLGLGCARRRLQLGVRGVRRVQLCGDAGLLCARRGECGLRLLSVRRGVVSS